MKKAKENWINQKCIDIGDCLTRNNTKRAYQIVKDLTKPKDNAAVNIQDINSLYTVYNHGKCITDKMDVRKRWTEYCSELYSHNAEGDDAVLAVNEPTDQDSFPILESEVEAAIRALKISKSPGVDNIPAELLKSGGDILKKLLTDICNKIWETGIWPSEWKKSLIISLYKKGSKQKCENYRTISLITHASKIMLKIILHRQQHITEEFISKEQDGFRKGRSTSEQIFNLRIISEKYAQHNKPLFHVFIDFKKAFDRVWHEALWSSMKRFNINLKLIEAIQSLYSKAESAVYSDGQIGEWFHTTTGVRQGCLLSPTLFNIMLEQIMNDALENHIGTVNIGGKIITNLRFADDIDGLAGSESELSNLIKKIDSTSRKYGMEINATKTQIMTNSEGNFTSEIKINNNTLKIVEKCKYLGAIIDDKGSKSEIIARTDQTITALSKLNVIWYDKSLQLKLKIRLMQSLVNSIFLYACETWTLTKELQGRIRALEMRCLRRLMNISYRDKITNIKVRSRVVKEIGKHSELLAMVIAKKLRWFGHVSRSNSMSNTILQGSIEGKRRRGRPRTQWQDNIVELTSLGIEEAMRATRDRDRWKRIILKSTAPLRHPNAM